MKQRTVQTLYAYWNALRAGRVAPRRLEIEPSRISSLLPETFMLERTGLGVFRYRLAGTRLCEIFGAELRETNALDGWSETDRATLARHLATTCEQGAATLLTIEADAGAARRLQIEAIFLPLIHAANTMDRVIGAMAAAAAPHWLGYEPLRAKRILRHELIWPDGRPHSVVERAGGKSPFLAVVSAGRSVNDERRKFRVFDGGRGKD
jgi:hypothetical protein